MDSASEKLVAAVTALKEAGLNADNIKELAKQRDTPTEQIDENIKKNVSRLRNAYQNLTRRDNWLPKDVMSRIGKIYSPEATSDETSVPTESIASNPQEPASTTEHIGELEDITNDTVTAIPDGNMADDLEGLTGTPENLPLIEGIITTAARRQKESQEEFDLRTKIYRRLQQGASADQLLAEVYAAFGNPEKPKK